MRVTCLFSWDENLLLDLDRLCLFSWDEISIVRMVARASDLDRLFVRCMCMVGSFGCWLMCLCPLFIVYCVFFLRFLRARDLDVDLHKTITEKITY